MTRAVHWNTAGSSPSHFWANSPTVHSRKRNIMRIQILAARFMRALE